jgi:alpha-glucosidase (family GH31 glycosyl hydrolase)
MLSNAHGKDQFNFARAAFHRSQPYLSALWGGDNRNNWHGMSGNMANAVRCGFMGFPVWGNDTGGYLGEGKIDEVMYTRWLQWSAWNGMFEVKIDGAGGSGEDRAPWKYPEKLQKIYKSVSDIRMSLLPYIYSCANTSNENGVMMKPLAYMYPKDKNTYNIWDEYLFGNAFLIAPMFSPENEREIYLPEGTWYDFYDHNNSIDGPATISKQVAIDNIPVFIKSNSIYITGNVYKGNSKIWDGDKEETITIHLFPGKEGEQTTFNYVDYLDNDKSKSMLLSYTSKQINFRSDKLTTGTTIEIKCPSEPVNVVLNDKQTDFGYDESKNVITVNAGASIGINILVLFK